MYKKREVGLLGGAMGLIAMGAALLTVSGAANGLEAPALNTMPAAPAPHSEPRIHVAQAAGARASYASDQADRGAREFENNCVECHGSDLRGGLLGGPPLRGLSFEGKYANGAPAGVLFEVMSGTMPPDAPGRFSADTYADLMAYILQWNGFPAGAPLPSDVDALYELIIEK